MSKRIIGVVVMSLLTATCASSMEHAPSEAARVLGIATFDVRESPSAVMIRGLDARGVEIGRVDLTVGDFEFELDERGMVHGRQMTVTVRGETIGHESEGLDRLTLPLGSQPPPIGAFLVADEVSSVLQRWGLGFDATWEDIAAAMPQGNTEVSYSTCAQRTYTSSPYQSDGTCDFAAGGICGNNTCVDWNRGAEKGEYRCCSGPSKLAERRCTAPYSTSSCGATGPNGCAVCWTITYLDFCSTFNKDGYAASCYWVETRL